MSSNDANLDKYNKDSRTACKYGTKCFQKNPAHRQKYKHPPKEIKENATHPCKKLKVETSNNEVKEVVTKHDLSDHDDHNIEDNSGTTSTNNETKKVNNDVSDSDITDDDDDESAKNGKLENRIIINNDVSDSDETDIENDETRKSKEDEKESKDNNSKTCEVNTNKKETIIGSLHPKEFIKEKFLVTMPEDFYQFWDFCKKTKPSKPSEVLKEIGLILVGPFDVLMGNFDKIKKSCEEYLVHWRYYHDPPELQTVLKGDDKTGYHVGYFRDSPEEPPALLVSNSAKKDGKLHHMGGNIFSAVNIYLEELKKYGDPFKKMHIGRIQTAVKKEAERLKIDLSQRTDAMVSREKKIVTRTFNKVGLVVPYDRRTQVGYRELALGNKELATLLTKLQDALPEQKAKYLSELQPVFTYASIATDECDFGTGIELGWNIISHDVDSLNSTALRFLTINYRLLNREVFAKIAEAHMNNRKRGSNLSII